MWIKAKVKNRLVTIHPGKNKTLENLREMFPPFKILVSDSNEEQHLQSCPGSNGRESIKGPLSILPPASPQVVQTRKQCGEETPHKLSLILPVACIWIVPGHEGQDTLLTGVKLPVACPQSTLKRASSERQGGFPDTTSSPQLGCQKPAIYYHFSFSAKRDKAALLFIINTESCFCITICKNWSCFWSNSQISKP